MRVILALAGAFFAALLAHVAIDVAGDYLLPHDTYDDDAHGSRYVASIALLFSVLVALYGYARAVAAETRGARGALCASLRSSIPSSPFVLTALVVGLAVPLLLGMAWLDSLVAGAPIDDVSDLFGGSLTLGIAIVTIASLATAIGLRLFVALVARFHRSIVRVARAIVHTNVPRIAIDACLVARRARERTCVSAFFGRCSAADRAPPASPTRIRLA
jgi:hypothetical protein